jgi:phospholipase C
VSVSGPPRRPDSRPFPGRPAGAVNGEMPFDHVVVVMMENHSFDNLLGALARSGQPAADGLTFDRDGAPTNTNPGGEGTPATVAASALQTTAQGTHATQSWNATHDQIDGGKMDGFVRSVDSTQPMGYYPPRVLPFAYSLARTFTIANRWFCSLPGPTYPNRRFLLAGTAYGGTVTDISALLDDPPPNGTIFDRLHSSAISWRNYFTDVPQTAVVRSTLTRYPFNHVPIAEFFSDCRAGSLPSVSFVDPSIGALAALGSQLDSLPLLKTLFDAIGVKFGPPAETQEDPQTMYYGEMWAHGVIEAVLQSPSWPRTLLIYTYDEHGGYYDHVPPPPAIAPDTIAPKLSATDFQAGYDRYGPRVPAVVVSPYSRPNSVTNVIHDHTSVLATIEAKWNLPALTFRDANAATVMDFLNVAQPAFLTPPVVQGPSASGPSGPAG